MKPTPFDRRYGLGQVHKKLGARHEDIGELSFGSPRRRASPRPSTTARVSKTCSGTSDTPTPRPGNCTTDGNTTRKSRHCSSRPIDRWRAAARGSRDDASAASCVSRRTAEASGFSRQRLVQGFTERCYEVSHGLLAPTSLLPGAIRRYFCAIPADRSAAKTPVVRFRAIVKPQNAVFAGALANEIKIDIG